MELKLGRQRSPQRCAWGVSGAEVCLELLQKHLEAAAAEAAGSRTKQQGAPVATSWMDWGQLRLGAAA